jgi:salicylate hydroxylase
MPPQGESGGMAVEDAILFARVMAATADQRLPERFAAYERLRKPHADRAFAEASMGWDTQKDSGWIAFYLRSWLTTAFLWWTAEGRQKRYSEDVATIELDLKG